jgi:single-strand DNA-binding protein
MNYFHGIGRLTDGAETKHLSTGAAVTKFSICINKVWRDRDGNKQERAHFFNCVAWGKYGEAMSKYMTKGKQIGITGELEQNTWQDNNGNNHSSVQINVSEIILLASPRNESGGANNSPPPPPGENRGPPNDDPYLN